IIASSRPHWFTHERCSNSSSGHASQLPGDRLMKTTFSPRITASLLPPSLSRPVFASALTHPLHISVMAGRGYLTTSAIGILSVSFRLFCFALLSFSDTFLTLDARVRLIQGTRSSKSSSPMLLKPETLTKKG